MPREAPDAELLIAPGCAHCPGVLEGLGQLVKSGLLGRLEIINILAHPEAAQQAGTRTVPWCRIGPFELEGLLSPAELEKWTSHAAQDTGHTEYYRHLLETQRPHKVSDAVRRHPLSITGLLRLLQDTQAPMAVRIGIGVVLEELHGDPVLLGGLPLLKELAGSPEANIRADAAHYLGLTGSDQAIAILRRMLSDEHDDVREIAEESLEQLQAGD